MEKKIIEYLGQPDSGCWGVEIRADYISYRSVWGDGMITFPEQKEADFFQIQATGSGWKIVSRVLGQAEMTRVVEEDGIESSHYWFLKRESKTTESTDVLKEFVKELENRHVQNFVKDGYISLQAGGEEILRIVDGNRISGGAVSKYDLDLGAFAEELLEKYVNKEIGFYINAKGYICE